MSFLTPLVSALAGPLIGDLLGGNKAAQPAASAANAIGSGLISQAAATGNLNQYQKLAQQAAGQVSGNTNSTLQGALGLISQLQNPATAPGTGAATLGAAPMITGSGPSATLSRGGGVNAAGAPQGTDYASVLKALGVGGGAPGGGTTDPTQVAANNTKYGANQFGLPNVQPGSPMGSGMMLDANGNLVPRTASLGASPAANSPFFTPTSSGAVANENGLQYQLAPAGYDVVGPGGATNWDTTEGGALSDYASDFGLPTGDTLAAFSGGGPTTLSAPATVSSPSARLAA